MLRFLVTFIAAASMGASTTFAQEQPAPSQPKPAEKAPEAKPATEPAPKTAAEKLKAAAKRYSDAKTYKDSGEVHIKFVTAQGNRTDRRPFSTAFERGGRFKWEFRSSAVPGGKPSARYVVWSSDQKSYRSWWDVTKQSDSFEELDSAMAGPTGVSGGSATAIIPLLRPDMRWGIKTTQLDGAKEAGTEIIDDAECVVIEGTRPISKDKVRLWLDSTMAIRKIVENAEIDPSKIPGGSGGEKFTTETTITFKPVFDQPVADEDVQFTPPK